MRELGDKTEIEDTFPDEHVLVNSKELIPWFADFLNYLASDIIPPNLSFHQRKEFMYNFKMILWMIHTCIGVVPMVLFGLVCQKFTC